MLACQIESEQNEIFFASTTAPGETRGEDVNINCAFNRKRPLQSQQDRCDGCESTHGNPRRSPVDHSLVDGHIHATLLSTEAFDGFLRKTFRD